MSTNTTNSGATGDRPPVPRALLSINEFMGAVGCSRTTTHRLVKSGRVRAVKIGRLVRIPVTEAERIASEGAR